MKKIFLLLILSNVLNAQSSEFKMKFGKISQDDLEMTECDFDPDAEAMVLGERSALTFDFERSGIVYSLKVHRRIKILKQKGKNNANEKIRFYHASSQRYSDKISSFKAVTYNLVDGKIEKSKLEKTDKFINDISDVEKELSFTMPNVKVGSVYEYKYTIRSGNIGTLKSIYLSSDLPIRDVEANYRLPEFLIYRTNMLGDLNEYETKQEKGLITMNGSAEISNNFTVKGHHIKAFRREPHMSNFWYSIPRVEFNLIKVIPQFSFSMDFGTSYKKLNELFYKSDYFGKKLNKGSFSSMWNINEKSDRDKAEFILKELQSTIVWNNLISQSSKQSPKKTWNSKKGSVGDINIALVAAMRYHGLEAYPILTSVRNTGVLHPVYANRFKFNYVLAMVVIDGKEYFCDASLKTPLGTIRTDALNEKGWLVDETGRWVDLSLNTLKKESTMNTLKIKDDVLYSKIEVQNKIYSSIINYDKFIHDIKTFEEDIAASIGDWQMDSIVYANENDQKLFKFIIYSHQEIEDPDFIIVEPIVLGAITENPFNSVVRNFNVDFIYKHNYNGFVRMEIPSGYEVELSESIRTKTEDGSMSYSSLVSQATTNLSIINKFNRTKILYSPTDYIMIKTFFDTVVKYNNQSFILKKMKE